MFEDCLPTPKKNGRPSVDKAVGILISLFVHILLAVAVYHGRFIVKIIPFEKEEVRNVVIVPPLKVTLPKVVGGRGLAPEPVARPGDEGPPATAGRIAGARQEVATPETVVDAPPGEAAAPAGAGSAIPSLSTKYDQMMANRPQPSGESGLTITLAPPGTPEGPPGFRGGAPLPDFSKYGRGAPGGARGAYGTRGGRGGSGTGSRQRVGISIPLKGYDLLPWASLVVDRIQRYWVLPPVYELPYGAKVRLIVVIKKSGELDSIEILEGTAVEVLDRAALEAVRAGLPFPALPDDFPGDLLEITFEFAYNG